MGITNFLFGSITVRIICPCAFVLLDRIRKDRITIENVDLIDDMIITCKIKRTEYDRLASIVKKSGYEINVIKRSGLYWVITDLKSRPVFLIGFAILLILTIYIPTRVLFVEINGNAELSDYQVLEAAQQCGISFGASRRNVRSEKMKNALLDALPQLQWAGVNTYGCVAVITVRERENAGENDCANKVSCIVATQDGIINRLTVESGSPLCRVGQVVKKNEKLVSGYTDCGRIIRAERSKGEVFAYTNRCLTVLSPRLITKKQINNEFHLNFSIIIGKKLINLSQDSGISDMTCDKIYKQIDFTLPGGFKLPLSIMYTYSKPVEFSSDRVGLVSMENAALNYLKMQMVSGEVLNSHIEVSCDNNVDVLDGVYFCNEMIGKEQSEEQYKR